MGRALWLPKAMNETGLPVYVVPGWEGRGVETFSPRGGVIHHDGYKANVATRNAISLLANGRGQPNPLAGPLCQIWIDDDNEGTPEQGDPCVYVIASGRANHAGPGGWNGLSGNTMVWGIEARNCFVAGTSVLTASGLIPIESVEVGDEVWTHRNRWRKVTKTYEHRNRERVEVKATGHPGIECSADHRFWTLSADCGPGRGFDRRRWLRRNHAERWTPAANLVGNMLLSPIIGDTGLDAPDVDGFAVTPELMWVVGRYVADGYLHRSDVSINPRDSKADETEGRIHAAGLRCRRYPKGSVDLIEIPSRALADWLELHFGRHATAKTIPAWLLGNDKLAQPFLEGLLHGDGHWKLSTTNKLGGVSQDRWELSTSSRTLAFGVRLLAQSIGMYAIVNDRDQRRDERVINGVTTRPTADGWKVAVWPSRPDRGGQLVEGDWSMSPVRSVTAMPGRVSLYDIEVEDDHSFVADGLAVHNSGGPADPWSPRMLDAYHRVVAALCHYAEHGPEMVCGHREWAPRRKPDPTFNLDEFRMSVKGLLGAVSSPVIPPPVVIDDQAGRLLLLFASSYDKQGGPGTWPTLKAGATGDFVRLVQGTCRSLSGAPNAIDGVYGPATQTAIANIQRIAQRGNPLIVVDGFCGFQTYQVLRFMIAVASQQKAASA